MKADVVRHNDSTNLVHIDFFVTYFCVYNLSELKEDMDLLNNHRLYLPRLLTLILLSYFLQRIINEFGLELASEAFPNQGSPSQIDIIAIFYRILYEGRPQSKFPTSPTASKPLIA